MNNNFLLSIVVPVYNEEEMISPFMDRIESVMCQIGCEYEVIFSLDPCTDNTYQVIKDRMTTNRNVKVMTFSRRVGQPMATLAGIRNCKGDACIIMDVDLQDPPEVICQMVEKWQEGYDVVYAQRISRDGETWLKLKITKYGYRMINKLSFVKIPIDTGDFRLINRKVIDELSKTKEHHGFLKGMVPAIGYKQVAVQYHRDARLDGISKYNPFFGSTRPQLNGIFCYSSKPMEYVTYLGAFVTAIGMLFTFVSGLRRLFSKKCERKYIGFGSYVTFLAGIIVFSIGIAGEYISRIYDEVTDRPQYIIDEFDENN